MDAYTTEEQDIETLKQWWQENGKSIVIGITVGLVAIFGWRAWQSSQIDARQSGSEAYEKLVNAVKEQTAQAVITQQVGAEQAGAEESAVEVPALSSEALDSLFKVAEPLLTDSSDTVYSDYGQLLLARQAVIAGDLDRAKSILLSLVDSKKDAAIPYIAQLRLARVYLALKEYEKGLEVLPELQQDHSYFAQAAEITGDIRLAQGDKAKAREAYERSLTATVSKRPFVQLKLNDLL